MSKPVIVFVGAVYPGQFGHLCDYLRETGQAQSFFLTTPGHMERNRERGNHILGFQPDGPIISDDRYYYSAKVERSARIGRGCSTPSLRCANTPASTRLWRIRSGGAAFPVRRDRRGNHQLHRIPELSGAWLGSGLSPDLAQRITDRNTEMLNFHQALNSDLVICPSQHAKNMFPAALRSRIEVQLEGFDFAAMAEPEPPASDKGSKGGKRGKGSKPVIGFAARDLSSAKGFETYVRLVDTLVERGVDAQFVAFGGAEEVTYGYEQQAVKRQHGGKVTTFRDHLMLAYPRAAKVIEFPGKLPYDEFASRIAGVDIFLYPLKFGVANWGLVEILGRGGCVLAPDRGYAAELIQDDINGRFCPMTTKPGLPRFSP
ncbi:glycosyl transferase family 1 [Sulfitobacter porphyrae]|uniref:Glycosyl transferase family 1 n=1 Tax=Sulfitobacter porphyrae TaxID=1246864 RepID=A0ABW2B022_9RHOB